MPGFDSDLPHVNAPERVVDLARSIAEKIHGEFGGEARTVWFGSWVRGDATNHSDIDLAIIAPAPLLHRQLAQLRAWVEDLPTLYSVDLVAWDEAPRSIQQEIMEYGVDITPTQETTEPSPGARSP